MKKILFAAFAALVGVFTAFAQENNPLPAGVDSAALATFNYLGSKLVNDLPNTHVIRYEDTKEILKSAEADGFGIEPYVAGAFGFADNMIVPYGGVNFRYDGKRFTYRVGAYAIDRHQNAESLYAGQHYLSYGATAALHVNLLYGGAHTNALSLFGEIGYLYGKHTKLVDEVPAEDKEGTYLKTVSHKGSGLTYAGGFEWRHNFFATGNALNMRVGYEALPNTFWNDTRLNGQVFIQLGFTFGINRHRVHGNIKEARRNRLR